MSIERLLAWDLAAARALRTLPHTAAADRLLTTASRVTDDAAGWILAGLIMAALDRRRRGAWVVATATVMAADRGSVAIKQLVGRRRPVLDGLAPLANAPSPLSFPSSHTASAVAAIVACRPLLRARALAVVPLAVACSRPYLGMHYPSDVIAGAAVGMAVGAAGRTLVSRLDPSGGWG